MRDSKEGSEEECELCFTRWGLENRSRHETSVREWAVLLQQQCRWKVAYVEDFVKSHSLRMTLTISAAGFAHPTGRLRH